MPYAIRKLNGKFAVVNKITGRKLGVHPTETKAKAQMRALYASEADEMMKK
jgi:hypothetical protein